MRFLIDAQLPPGLADLLVATGHQAVHVEQVGLLSAADTEIWAYARKGQFVLVTKDQDFTALLGRDALGPAVLWIRLGNTTNRVLWQALRPRLDEIVEALEAGEALIEVG